MNTADAITLCRQIARHWADHTDLVTRGIVGGFWSLCEPGDDAATRRLFVPRLPARQDRAGTVAAVLAPAASGGIPPAAGSSIAVEIIAEAPDEARGLAVLFDLFEVLLPGGLPFAYSPTAAGSEGVIGLPILDAGQTEDLWRIHDVQVSGMPIALPRGGEAERTPGGLVACRAELLVTATTTRVSG